MYPTNDSNQSAGNRIYFSPTLLELFVQDSLCHSQGHPSRIQMCCIPRRSVRFGSSRCNIHDISYWAEKKSLSWRSFWQLPISRQKLTIWTFFQFSCPDNKHTALIFFTVYWGYGICAATKCGQKLNSNSRTSVPGPLAIVTVEKAISVVALLVAHSVAEEFLALKRRRTLGPRVLDTKRAVTSVVLAFVGVTLLLQRNQRQVAKRCYYAICTEATQSTYVTLPVAMERCTSDVHANFFWKTRTLVTKQRLPRNLTNAYYQYMARFCFTLSIFGIFQLLRNLQKKDLPGCYKSSTLTKSLRNADVVIAWTRWQARHVVNARVAVVISRAEAALGTVSLLDASAAIVTHQAPRAHRHHFFAVDPTEALESTVKRTAASDSETAGGVNVALV